MAKVRHNNKIIIIFFPRRFEPLFYKFFFVYRSLTKKPQLAGTDADEELAGFILNEWKLMGIDVSLVNYTVLLSYPDVEKPNLVIKTFFFK